MHFLLLMHSHCTTKALAWHRWPSSWPMLSTCMELQFLSSLFRKAPLGLFHLPTLHSRSPQMQLLMGQGQGTPRSMLRHMPSTGTVALSVLPRAHLIACLKSCTLLGMRIGYTMWQHTSCITRTRFDYIWDVHAHVYVHMHVLTQYDRVINHAGHMATPALEAAWQSWTSWSVL